METDFTALFKKHSGATQDKRVFAGLLKDLFPGQARETNLLATLFDMGLAAEINGAAQISNALAYRFVKRLVDEYGVSRGNADWAVAMWCVCYGRNILGKPCEIKISGAKGGGELSIREEKSTGKQYQDLFTYRKAPNSQGYAVSGFTGDNRRTIIFPNKHNGKTVTAITAGAFSESDVQEAIMTDGLTSIGDRAFSGCLGLKQAIFPDTLVEVGSHVFAGCAELKTAMLPSRLERIADYAFAGTGIKPAELPKTLYWLGEGVFSNCLNISEMTIPTNVTSLPDKVFRGCQALKKVMLHDRLESIGVEAFAGCVSLSSLIVPDSVKNIGDKAFSGAGGEFTLLCGRGSFAEIYARTNGLRFQLI